MTVGESFTDRFPCVRCGKSYLRKRHLQRHMRDECIGIPPRFTCHLCPSRFRRKYHMVRHLTSKHGIPPPVAQQATGSGSGNNAHTNASSIANAGGGGTGKHVKNNGYDGSDRDSPIPENLSMRKENFEHETKSPGVQVGAVGLIGGAGSGGSGVVSGSSGGGHSSGAAAVAVGPLGSGGLLGRDRKSPPLPTSLPTYGLTGAITAISAAAAAAVVAQTEESENLSMKPRENVIVAGGGVDPACSGGASVVAVGGASGAIKTEPISPGKAAAQAVTNLMDDEWKMKLSLQLISNSLLKERLLNSMPFAYNNKN